MLLSHISLGQTRGQIIKSGDSVLDPNGDGYISKTTDGFSIDGYYVDEFELNMFGLPFAGDGEASGDGKQTCTTTDLATDTTGFSAYGVLEDDNLIFRFRLAGDRPSVEAYTILIDTDNLIGTEDPNYTSENPGFEVDITLIKNASKGVYVYDLDGIDSCPEEVAFYPYSTHFQSSVAGTTSCDDADYFYDFYVPFQMLTDEFGINAQSELRFIALTNVSATCAMGGAISDIGGVNDSIYDGDIEAAILDLTTDQCPTALEDLCQTCGGFAIGSTEKPVIDQPVKVGETEITGSAELTASVFLTVFDVDGNLVEDVTTEVDDVGNWEIVLTNSLKMEDSIIARAQLAGTCSSGISESDLSYAVAIINQAPTISATTTVLSYIENNSPLAVFDDFSIADVDDTEMDSAWVTVTANYDVSQDQINLPPGQGLNISWNAGLNRVELYGQALLSTYESVIQGITYSNSSEDPTEVTRSFSVKVHDGLLESNALSRDLIPVKVNDASVLSGTTGSLISYDELDPPTVIDEAISVSDVDDIELEGARITISANYDPAEDTLQFTDQNGISSSFDDANGVLDLNGTATLANYIAALRSVLYYNPSATITNQATRTVRFRVFDGADSSNVFDRFIDITASNAPPDVVDSDGNPLPDTIYISMTEDIPLDTCIDAVDPDGDFVSIASTSLENNKGTVDFDPDNNLCFVFTPEENYFGEEYIKIKITDGAVPEKFDSVVVALEIAAVNDLPEIVDEVDAPIDTAYFSTDEDTPVSQCIDAYDAESDPLELTNAYSWNMNGTVVIDDASGFCYTYTPNTDFNGSDSLNLVVCEQGSITQCDTLVAVIDVLPVNDKPVIEVEPTAIDTVSFEALEDVITKLCLTANDPDKDVISVVSAENLEGPGIFEPDPPGDLCFNFQSSPNANGVVYGQVVVCDNQSPALCDTVVVEITITPVNDKPYFEDEVSNPLTSFDTLYFDTTEDVNLDICINASDPDTDPLTMTQASSIQGNGSFNITDAEGLCFSFSPNLNFYGREIGKLTICDDGGLCATQVVVVDITADNDKPVIVDEGIEIDTIHYELDEDTAAEFCLEAIDVDGHPTSLSSILSDNPNGLLDPGDLTDLCFEYTPAADFFGETVAKLIVCDDQSPALCDTVVAVISVIQVNDNPVIEDNGVPLFGTDTLFLSTQEDTPFDICVQASDPDGDPLILSQALSSDGNGSYVITDGPGLCLNFTPDPDYNGQDAGLITVCEDTEDSLCASVVVVVDITSVNDAPEIIQMGSAVDTVFFNVSEDVTTELCLSAEDVDNNPVNLSSITTESSEVALEASGGLCFDFIPAPNMTGQVYGQAVVCDEGLPVLCDTVVVSVMVYPVNDPPVFSGLDDTLVVSTQEDIPVSFTLEVFDPDGDELTFSAISSDTNLGTYTELETGTYEFEPTANINGVEYATISICDGGMPEYCDVLVLQINIAPVNDAPVGVNDTIYVITYYSISGNVLENDWDIEDHELFVVTDLEQEPRNGELSITENGNFTYKPKKGYKGTDGFAYLVCDRADPSECDEAQVFIQVEDPLVVYEAISPNGDTFNDTWFIEGIENYPNNQVKIFDRYNRVVYEMNGYNNQDKIWTGQTNRGLIQNDLPTGTYFYIISLGFNEKPISGYLILKTE